MRGKGYRLGGREMFFHLNYWQDEGALEGPQKDGETIFQRIRQRQGCEEKQALYLYTIGRRRRSYVSLGGVSLMCLFIHIRFFHIPNTPVNKP